MAHQAHVRSKSHDSLVGLSAQAFADPGTQATGFSAVERQPLANAQGSERKRWGFAGEAPTPALALGALKTHSLSLGVLKTHSLALGALRSAPKLSWTRSLLTDYADAFWYNSYLHLYDMKRRSALGKRNVA